MSLVCMYVCMYVCVCVCVCVLQLFSQEGMYWHVLAAYLVSGNCFANDISIFMIAVLITIYTL